MTHSGRRQRCGKRFCVHGQRHAQRVDSALATAPGSEACRWVCIGMPTRRLPCVPRPRQVFSLSETACRSRPSTHGRRVRLGVLVAASTLLEGTICLCPGEGPRRAGRTFPSKIARPPAQGCEKPSPDTAQGQHARSLCGHRPGHPVEARAAQVPQGSRRCAGFSQGTAQGLPHQHHGWLNESGERFSVHVLPAKIPTG